MPISPSADPGFGIVAELRLLEELCPDGGRLLAAGGVVADQPSMVGPAPPRHGTPTGLVAGGQAANKADRLCLRWIAQPKFDYALRRVSVQPPYIRLDWKFASSLPNP